MQRLNPFPERSFNPNDPLNVYELNTVTYGLAPSAFQAILVLLQLAIDESEKFPKASRLIFENMYVDDASFGGDSILEAIDISREFSDCLKLLSNIPFDWLEINPNESQNLTKDQKLLGRVNVPLLDTAPLLDIFY